MEELIHYSLVFLGASIFSMGLINVRSIFYNLSLNTIATLDIILAKDILEEQKQNQLIQQNIILITSLSKALILLLLICIASLFPMLIFLKFDVSSLINLKLSIPILILSSTLGSILPFIIFSSLRKPNLYTKSAKLLHNISLNHYNLSKLLFNVEKRIFAQKLSSPDTRFFIVSGLARSGTTALTSLLYNLGEFHSLTYANMPFLISPGLWRKIYHPKKGKLKERKHQDKIYIHYKSIEAFEEFFFKVFTNNSYITDKYLLEHHINSSVFNEYINYQKLIRSSRNNKSFYLAKNNNLLLRFKSLTEHSKEFRAIFLFREPHTHAVSLLTQHQQFCTIQKEDEFTRTYMNWLCHHEFGLDHKVFLFDKDNFNSQYPLTSINYWVEIWIYYYEYLLNILIDERYQNILLIDNNDLANHPNELIKGLFNYLNINFYINPITPYIPTSKNILDIDSGLNQYSIDIYNKLFDYKFNFSDYV